MILSSLGRTFGKISLLTAASRIFGLLRDIVFAIFLGAGPATDAFLVALKLPNMFRRLSAEGALTNAFIPSYANERTDQGEIPALRLAGEVQTMLVLVLVALVLLCEFFMPTIVSLLAPGFTATPDRFDAAVTLARITMPYLVMISLVAFWAAIANAHDWFVPGAAMPVLFNICLISGALLIPQFTGGYSAERALPIAWALLVAGALQMTGMYLVLRHLGKIPTLIWWPQLLPATRRMWHRFVPAAFGAIGMQINLIVDLVLASLLQVGAISWLYYADRVAQLPLGIVGIALGTALLPRLSKAEAVGDVTIVKDTLSEAIILGGFFIIPAVAALFLLAEPIMLGLFTYGAFAPSDAMLAAVAMVAYAVGLPGFVLIKILQPAFYAASQPAIVLKISIVMVVTNIVGSLLLMGPFGHVGLAMATSGSGLLAAAIMLVMLRMSGKLNLGALSGLLRILGAAAVMMLVLFGALRLMPEIDAIWRLVIFVGIGGLTYFCAAILFGAVPAGLFHRNHKDA